VAVNRHATIDLMHALSERGAGSAVCYASGFAESGPDGEALQAQLARAAGGVPFIGPNCHGLINYLDGIALWPEQHGGTRLDRGVALITQSGNLALNATMQARGVPLAYVVTLGNQACVALADVIDALLDDQRVTAIALHIESIAAPGAFMSAAAAARSRGVPLVALQSGRTALAARLTVSHTASLAGAAAVSDAFLHRAGVARVTSMPALLEALKLLHVHGPLRSREIASMSCSGGEAALVADAAQVRELHFRPFTVAQAKEVADALPPLACATNPLDYHNFSWHDEAALERIYRTVMSADFALTLLILDFPRADRCTQQGFDRALRALSRAANSTDASVAVVSTLPELIQEARAQELLESGIAPLCGLEEAMQAIAAAAFVGQSWREPGQPWCVPAATPRRATEHEDTQRPEGAGTGDYCLTEWESKQLLASHGVRIPRGEKVDTLDATVAAAAQAAVHAAATIGYPVALKSVGRRIIHKTEIGAVSLGLTDAAAVRAAAIAQVEACHADLLVEEMLTDAVAELLVGVNRDPVFGHYLVLGSGGMLVELVGDSRVLLMPATPAEIAAGIGALRVSALLQGYRSRPPGDLQAAIDAVMAIQGFALREQHRLLELDINPLIIRPTGRGAVAVDALIRFASRGQTDE